MIIIVITSFESLVSFMLSLHSSFDRWSHSPSFIADEYFVI